MTKEEGNKIFTLLKNELEECCPPMVIKANKSNIFEIIADKPVPYGSKKKIIPGMYFASIVVYKSMVSFYFFPIYTQDKIFKTIAPSLLKSLKGKSCFNFTKIEQVNEKELKAILKKGIDVWKKAGYMK